MAAARAAQAPAVDPTTGLPPEIAALLAARPTWTGSIALQAGIGYKDNLVLSRAAPERSSFARYGVEAFAWRLPRGRTDFSAILSAEETRYFSGETVKREANAYTQFQARYRIEDTFRFAFDVQGYHLDEIRDVSDTDVQRVVAELNMVGAAAGPSVRWSPRPWLWLEVQALGKRDSHRDGAYNAKVANGEARLGWRPSERFEFSASYGDLRRRYDQRQQFSRGGNPIDDTLLVITEREIEGRLDVKWGAAARWVTSTRVGGLEYEDNGTGYFDYRQKRVSQSLEWTNEQWLVNFDGAAKRREFDRQVVGGGLAPPPRIIEDFSVELRVERKLSERWTAFLHYSWERSRSNEAIASYRVNEGLLGARWSWEK